VSNSVNVNWICYYFAVAQAGIRDGGGFGKIF